MTIFTPKDFPRWIAKFLDTFPEGGVFGLSGTLGVGKTTFVRAFIAYLSAQRKISIERVLSPSFVFHSSYHTYGLPVEHWDLYRLDGADAFTLTELGYYDRIEQRRTGWHFIEWPEKALRTGDLCLTDTVLFEEIKGTQARKLRLKSRLHLQ